MLRASTERMQAEWDQAAINFLLFSVHILYTNIYISHIMKPKLRFCTHCRLCELSIWQPIQYKFNNKMNNSAAYPCTHSRFFSSKLISHSSKLSVLFECATLLASLNTIYAWEKWRSEVRAMKTATTTIPAAALSWWWWRWWRRIRKSGRKNEGSFSATWRMKRKDLSANAIKQ